MFTTLRARCSIYRIILLSCVASVVLSIALSTTLTYAANYHFERIDGNQGLYKRTITCGLQDKFGFLWFGSEDGLLRYDGYEFKEFIYSPDNVNSLSSNLVYSLMEDHKGMLWIGTVGGGLNKYNPFTGTFTRYSHDSEDVNSLSHNAVISLLEDSKGRIWIGTEGGGLNRLDPGSENFIHYKHNPEDKNSISFDSMWHLYEDKDGLIWIGTHGGGLNVLDPESGEFTSYRHDANDESTISSDVVGPIFVDSVGNMWVGGIGGLNLFSQETETFQRFCHEPNNSASIGNNHVWDIIEAGDGDLWIGSFGGGVSHFDVEKKLFTTINHSDNDLRSLSSNLVWCIFKSQDGVMWIGTDGGGLNKFVERTEAFNHYTASENEDGHLAYDGVNGVAEDMTGTLWMANDGGGIQSFNPRSGKSQLFVQNLDNANSLNSNLTETIFVDHSGIVWIGTYNGGLNAYNPKTSTFTHYLNDTKNIHSISDNRVWALYEDSKNNLWVGTRNGLNRLDPERKYFKRFQNDPTKPGSLSDNGIWSVFEDKSGSLWVGTDNGLNRMVDEETFEKYFSQPDIPTSLSHNTTTVIFQTSDQTLWIGTNGGLNRLNIATGEFTRYSEKDGLANNSIRGIMEDGEKNLWVTTVNGLTKFSPQNLDFHTYHARDGLQGSEFSRAHFKRSDGSMVIGGRNGINIFRPDQIINNGYKPQVVLTRFSKKNKEINPGKYINPKKTINLDYDDSTLTFEFAGLDYNNPSANTYLYKLEGFEDEWVQAGSRRHATYTNLNGGKYSFRVKAANNHGVWSNEEISLPVFKAPPPWKRWWAYTIYFLAVLATLVGFIELRAKRDKERIANVEGMNRKLASEVKERRKVEKALVLSEQRLLMALEAAHEAIWEFQPKTGTAFFSNTWFTMLGYEVDAFDHSYDTWAKLIHPEDFEKVHNHLTRYLEGKESEYHIEFRMLAKNGGEKWILSTGKVQERDRFGKPETMSGIHMDITSRKHNEQEKQRLETALQHASKMEAIGTLAGGVAHDFNNILSAIVGYSELGLIEVEKGTSVHRKFERMLQAAYRARDLVQQILTFSRKDKRELQPIHLAPIIDEALQLIRSTLPVTISIKSDIAPDIKHILADQTQIHQVIVNLCTNAAHAMEEDGGVLTIGLREKYQSQNEIMGQVPLKPGLYAELMIEDTGAGITQENIVNIFNPYFTTKHQGKGSGLGLSVVLGIVQNCGGTIRVESEAGEGATFIVLLPVIEEIVPVQVFEEKRVLQSKECRVLLIDDEEPLVDILSQLLEDMGNEVVAFQDASAAVELFKKDPQNFDLVITDMTMPTMTGDKVAVEVKATRPDMPVIICTGYSNKAFSQSISDLGGDALLMKPVERDKLIETINSVLS